MGQDKHILLLCEHGTKMNISSSVNIVYVFMVKKHCSKPTYIKETKLCVWVFGSNTRPRKKMKTVSLHIQNMLGQISEMALAN